MTPRREGPFLIPRGDAMNYTNLGRTGLKVSRLCLGCMSFGVPQRGGHLWTLDEEQSRPFIKRALDLGINFLDTPNSYSDGTRGRSSAGPSANSPGATRW